MLIGKYAVCGPPVPVTPGVANSLYLAEGLPLCRHWEQKRDIGYGPPRFFYAPPGSKAGQPSDAGNGWQDPGPFQVDRKVLVEGSPTRVAGASYNSADRLRIAAKDYISQARGELNLLPFIDIGFDGKTRAAYVLDFQWESGGDEAGVHVVLAWHKAGLDSGCRYLVPIFNAGTPDNDGKPGHVEGAPLCMGSLVESASASAFSNLVAAAKEIAQAERLPLSQGMHVACHSNDAYMAYRRSLVLQK
jgi:hypothetical protein